MQKILFLSRWFPYPADNGAKIRIYNLLKQLRTEFEIDLVSFATGPVADDNLKHITKVCKNIKVVPYRPFRANGLKAKLGFLWPYPRSTLDTYNITFNKAVQELVSEKIYDVVIASEVDMIPYVRAISRRQARVRVFEELEITNLYENIYSGIRAKLRHQLMWRKWQLYLSHQMRYFDAFTVVSEQELKKVFSIFGNHLSLPGYIIPNGVAIDHYSSNYPPQQPDTLIYAGALSYHANFDAVDFFIRDILPNIIHRRPNTRFSITGKTNGVPLDKLPASDHVVFTGYVEDIRPVIAQSWASVVPLRQGGGTRLKILESLALGTPVVATSKGAEGLDLIAGEDILIADNPKDFGEATIQLLGNPALRQQLSQQGQCSVKKYDWANIGKDLIKVIAETQRQTQH